MQGRAPHHGGCNQLIRLIITGSLAIAACSQTLETPPAAVAPGSANILRVVFKPKPDRPIVAVQWELAVPGELQIAAADVVTGTAAESAAKSLNCSARNDPKTGKLCVCILAGGVKALPEGAIAIVKFAAPADAKPGTVTVRLRKIQGVSTELKSVPIADVEAAITIR